MSEIREKILKGTIQVFNKKGLKLTMDDVADELKISKKTIYKEFSSKEEMFETMADYVFDNIKVREEEIINEDGYSTAEKIRLLLSAMPESYRNINFQELHPLKDKYPKVYKKLQRRLETGWEPTMKLLEQGKEEGIIKPDADLKIFKIMMEASLERFFEQDVMKGGSRKYNDYLNEVVDILLTGISV
jgi:AcrR family transcriptional regulator